MQRSKASAVVGLLVIVISTVLFGSRALGADTGTVRGKIIDAATGLALAGVLIQTEGPTVATATSDRQGEFQINDLTPGYYNLLMYLSGYVTTESDAFGITANATSQPLTLALQRGEGVAESAKVLGVTTVRAAASLQKAALIYKSVSAEPLLQQGYYRVGDYINQLPGLQGGNFAQPGDDLSLNIRGIGQLETLALIDGHPVGPRANYNYEMSPVFGLRSVDVFYGSGGSDLYGVDSIGGVIDMETLDPTVNRQVTFSQAYGTWGNLATSLQATGTQPGGKLGYAFAYGTQGLDGPFHHALMYQASASSDPFSTDPAVHAAAVYPDDTSFTNKSGLAKLRYNFSPSAHLTAAMLSGSEWDDKTGNGDNDYLPYQVQFAAGQGNLASAIQSGTDPCNQINPKTFQVNPNDPCQTPASFANATFGYQGAGPAWQSYNSNDYHVKYDNTSERNAFVIDAFTNFYLHTYDRTFGLPCCNPFWRNLQDTNTGVTVSDDVQSLANDFGAGVFFENTASLYRVYTGDPAAPANVSIASPITHDSAFFFRDAYHAPSSDLTTYVNTWFKHSTITNTSYVDPRIAFILNKSDNVYRAAIGRTSTQPTPDMLDQPFTPSSVGGFSGGGVSCSALNAVGNVPSSDLQPEQATDEEMSYGHRFSGDSIAQLTLYSTNLFGQIYGTVAPLSSVSLPGFDPTPFANVVQQQCPGLSLAQAESLLGVSGNVNIGHTVARGIELTGRQRWTSRFFTDYTYDTQSSFLQSNEASLINPADGGQLVFITGSQLPNIPLHKYSFAFDYTTPAKLEARVETYFVSINNANNLPAYNYSNLVLSRPVGPSTLSLNIDNLFNQNSDYRNAVGLGVPLPLNGFAGPSDYQQYFGAGATELFHLPFRTIEIHYTTRIR